MLYVLQYTQRTFNATLNISTAPLRLNCRIFRRRRRRKHSACPLFCSVSGDQLHENQSLCPKHHHHHRRGQIASNTSAICALCASARAQIRTKPNNSNNTRDVAFFSVQVCAAAATAAAARRHSLKLGNAYAISITQFKSRACACA